MDREKVIKETKDGIAFAESRGFGGLANTMRDALELLKEQQQKKGDLLKRFDEEIESARKAVEDCSCDGDHSGVVYFQHKQHDYKHARSIIENVL